MKKEVKIWEDRILPELSDNLIICFEIPTWEEEQVIYLKFFWKGNEVDIYCPVLEFRKPCVIRYTFGNGIYIEGKLEIKKFSDPDRIETLGVFADFYYYRSGHSNYIWHTEGFLISFFPEVVVVDELIVDEIIAETIIEKAKPPVVEDEQVPLVSTSDYSDLFPYIYVSGWPTINRWELKWNFFPYTPTVYSPPQTTFYDTLAQLKAAGKRTDMTTEAVSFIEGSAPYTGRYVYNPTALSGYIGDFSVLYAELLLLEDLANPVAIVCAFFDVSVAEFTAYLSSKAYLDDRERLWESYFALLIELGYARENLEDIALVLTTCNFVECVFLQDETALSVAQIDQLLHATILLPATVFPLPPYTSSPPVSQPAYLLPYAIGDLQLVKYKLLRYQVGEMASVVSILPGEKRKSVHRKLDRVVDKEVSKTHSQKDSENDEQEQSDDFNEELWNALAETTETTNYPDPGLISTYGPPTDITIKGSYTRARTTQTPDKKQVSSFAKKILNRTTQRLSEKVNKVRARMEWNESENTSESIIDNRNGTTPIYGFNCWVNKIYEARVVRYGNRMLLSFIVPQPAAAYIRQTQTLNGVDLQEPKSLADFKVYTYTDITTSNYLSLCQYYGLNSFPLPPAPSLIVSDIGHLGEGKLIPIPPGYCAASANLEYAFGDGSGTAVVNGFLGQHTFTIDRSTGAVGSVSLTPLNDEQSSVPMGTAYTPVIQVSPPATELDFQLAVEITCTPTSETVLNWQISVYQELENAYTAQSRAYHSAIGAGPSSRETQNPQGERLIVHQELEKSIRQQLLEYALALNGLPSDLMYSTAAPSIQYNQPEILQYLQTALEWNELSYTFFDEYDDHNGLFAVSAISPDFFSAFLHSNYARVLIPVNPTCNYGLLYFLANGIVWPARDVFAPCLDPKSPAGSASDQASVANEIKKVFAPPYQRTTVTDQWEVVVPTSMQILQNKPFIYLQNYD